MSSIIKQKIYLKNNLKKIYKNHLESPVNNYKLCFDDLIFSNVKTLFKRKVFPRTRIIKNNNIIELKLNTEINCHVNLYENEVLSILYNFIIKISDEESILNEKLNIDKKQFINAHLDFISEYEPFIGVKVNDIEYFGYSNFLENSIKNIFKNVTNIQELENFKIEFLESNYEIIAQNFFEIFIYFDLINKDNFLSEEEKILLLMLNCESDSK